MRLLLDSFWRSVAYCMHPRVIVLSLLPLGLMVLLAAVFGYFYWDASVAWTREALDAWPLLSSFWGWIGRLFSGDVTAMLAPLLVVFAATPLIVVVSLLIVAGFMAPALTRLVAERRFPSLEQKRGASFIGSMFRSLGLTLLALLALVVSMPLWLIPPLVLILPPLIWGWLTYRVMSYDALAEHASPEERDELLRIHRLPLMGVRNAFRLADRLERRDAGVALLDLRGLRRAADGGMPRRVGVPGRHDVHAHLRRQRACERQAHRLQRRLR